jgi:glycosyltransferase involved in cell wall biosynthesis
MARNTGLEHATGTYICFFDSDDFIEPDTIEMCVAAALRNHADLVIFGHDDVTPELVRIHTHVPCPPKFLFVGEEIRSVLLPMAVYGNLQTGEDWNIPSSAWNKLYSLDVIKKSEWRFVSEREIISEDFYSLTKLYGYLNRVVVLDRVFYHYTVNNASLSRSYRSDRFERIKLFYNEMLLLSENMKLQRELEQSIKGVTFGLVIGTMKQIVASDLGLKHRYLELQKIIQDDFLQNLIRSTEYSGVGFQKKLLYKAAEHKLVWLCFLLVYLKNKRNA